MGGCNAGFAALRYAVTQHRKRNGLQVQEQPIRLGISELGVRLAVTIEQEKCQAVVQGSQAGATSSPQLVGVTAPQEQHDLKVHGDLRHLGQLRILRHKLQKRFRLNVTGLICVCLPGSGSPTGRLRQLPPHVCANLLLTHALVESYHVGGLSFGLDSEWP